MGSGALIAIAVAAAIIFVAVACVTRATQRLIAAALIAGILAAAVNIAWDAAAFHAGWWHYFEGVEYAPLMAYVPVVLVYGGALGLIGRHIIRRFGAPGAIAFFIAVTAWGVFRDHLVAARTGILVFGSEPRASVADGIAYLSVAILVQVVLHAICRG